MLQGLNYSIYKAVQISIAIFKYLNSNHVIRGRRYLGRISVIKFIEIILATIFLLKHSFFEKAKC